MKSKRVISVSLGSSRRNHRAVIDLFGCRISIERLGVDGDKKRFNQILRELDGSVDAIGLGGVDLFLRAGRYQYLIKEVAHLIQGVHRTPIVDGGILKQCWEREVPSRLVKQFGLELSGKTALCMSGMDRYGLAEGLEKVGCQLLIADMPFALGIPIALRRLRTLRLLSVLMMPILRRLPLDVLYPTGVKQERRRTRFPVYFERADIISGDFHYINRFRPPTLSGKMIITNTLTAQDVEELRSAGARILVTTTPEIGGRSFGANVLEAIFIAILEKPPEEITGEEYITLMKDFDLQPRVIFL
ncbi:MAG TPA: hypothetical protein VLH40_08475 [Atribacteraceae bacterium]|nr:hypothetical protein [Atribacteraceae bacterium]